MLIPIKALVEKYHIKPTGIIHCGAHWGEEAADYYNAGFKRVLWIECMPDAYEILKSRVGKYGHLCLKACLGDEDGKEVTFNVSNNEGQSSSYLELGTHKIVHPEVDYIANYKLKTVRLDSVLKHNEIYVHQYPFINMDLQGAELLALKGMGDTVKYAKYLYLEVNKAELYVGCPLIEELDEYLKPYGFSRVETEWAGNTNWGDAFYIKHKNED